MRNKIFLPLWTIGILALSGCVKEDLADCPEPEQGVILKYRYDLNMDYADKFAERVENLQAFIFDAEGILRDKLVPFVGKGTIVPNWERRIDLAPGNYSVVTWAGSDKFYDHFYLTAANEDAADFAPGVTIGRTRLEDLRMFLKYRLLDGSRTGQKRPNATNIKDLYHGLVQNVAVQAEGFTTITTPLTKDTKTVRIRIDGLSKLGNNVAPGDFEMSIAGRNSHYRYDNAINEQASLLTYVPYQSQVQNGALHTEIKTLRLMKPQSDPFSNAPLLLSIRYIPTGLVICQDVDMVGLILDGKIPARDSQGMYQTDDEGEPILVSPTLEYLDRQDVFDVVFEISKDPNGDELIFTVYVNGWKVTNMYPVPTF